MLIFVCIQHENLLSSILLLTMVIKWLTVPMYFIKLQSFLEVKSRRKNYYKKGKWLKNRWVPWYSSGVERLQVASVSGSPRQLLPGRASPAEFTTWSNHFVQFGGHLVSQPCRIHRKVKLINPIWRPLD